MINFTNEPHFPNYEEQREQYLSEQFSHNLYMSDLWAKRAEGTEYCSMENQKASEYGKIASFYYDAICAIKTHSGHATVEIDPHSICPCD